MDKLPHHSEVCFLPNHGVQTTLTKCVLLTAGMMLTNFARPRRPSQSRWKKETSPRRQSDGLCTANGQESSRWAIMIIIYGCVDSTIMTEPMTKPNNLFVVVSIVPSLFFIRKIWLVNGQQILLHFAFFVHLAEGSGPTRLPPHISSPCARVAAALLPRQVKGVFRDTTHPVELAEFSAIFM